MSANPDFPTEQPSNIIPFDDPRARASLYCKMARVMGELTRLEKTGYNSFHKYKYASESDVADAVRHAMAINNLALFVQIVRVERIDTGRKTSGGSPTILTRVQVEFTFADGDTGATEHRLWEGEALDSDDKGVNKAVTAAEKYFLLKTFVMSSGDKVDDPDESADEPAQPKSRQRQQPQQRPATPPAPPLKIVDDQKPATDGTSALQPEKNTVHWSQDAMAWRSFRSTIEEQFGQLAERLPIDWTHYETPRDGFVAVQKFAADERWPLISRKATYIPGKDGKGGGEIQFHTPLFKVSWFAGRTELDAATEGLISAKEWKPGDNEIAIPVRITWSQKTNDQGEPTYKHADKVEPITAAIPF